ncbi:MAG: hypothetical protein HY834_17835 [Devosia nanyangense]|uniref:Alpha/beta hydrolase n=1 Tax=Devosia nanyangense TaxID=1228055 RepID=A0A933L775_9HYPH|nr:hypothetical protein [Devosia nanyangense]
MAEPAKSPVRAPRRRAAGKAPAAAATRTASSKRGGVPKTAVIVVHGMGEQKPLETIQSFVESVYQHDKMLASDNTDERNELRISIVPDSATGSSELRRLTTLRDGPPKRTDFFEFYWADIMDGTPVEIVSAWIRGLLLRAPWRVPGSIRVFSAWLILWVLTIAIVAAAAMTADPQLARYVPGLPWLLAGFAAHHVEVAKWAYLAGALLLAWKIWNGLTAGRRQLESVTIMLPVLLMAGGVALALLPRTTLVDPHVWAGAVTALFGWAMNALVAPYLGDVVRYVRATPGTVARRKEIRERGLELLERIHAKRLADGDDWARADDPPYYDRIVLVGHSLGSVIAYDLLQLFWERHGPTHHQQWAAGRTPMQRALKRVDLYVRKVWGRERPLRAREERAFLDRQAQLGKQLAAEAPHWRITDFVTLGSPLAHAAFLLTDSEIELEQAFRERRFAASPPRPDPLLGSMLYPGQGPAGPLFPHFAAQFAAVKWTNICDENPVPIFGDLVSGKLRDRYGPGIVEHNVQIERPGLIWPLSRIFTHTEYWTWDESYRKPGAAVPPYLQHLRDALRLGA